VGSELAGQRAAVVMSLVQSAKLNGLDPWAYLRDVLARIHTHPNHHASTSCCRTAGGPILRASSGGTAFPTCVYWEVLLPRKT
jgi:hypothetical protein